MLIKTQQINLKMSWKHIKSYLIKQIKVNMIKREIKSKYS